MALILDTNALSAFADGDPGLRREIGQETDLALPAVVLGEYMFGIANRGTASGMKSGCEFTCGSFLFLMSALRPPADMPKSDPN